MVRRMVIVLAVVLGLGVVATALLTLAPTTRIGNGKLFGIATLPEVAVRDMLQVSANRLQNFRILVDEPWGLRRILVYSYTVQPAGQPPHNEFGYALTEMRMGWSAIPGPPVADASVAARVTYVSTLLDTTTIVYGKVLDPQVTILEATFNNGLTQRIEPVKSGFLLRAKGQVTLETVRLFDAQGQVLQQHNAPNVYERAHW
jgi:hypothetical protein